MGRNVVMPRLGDVVKISPSTTPLEGEQHWLLNLDMVEQQTGRVIAYYYVDAGELDGSIIQFDTDAVLYSKLRPNLNKVVLPEQAGFATSEMLPLVPDTAVLTREYLTYFLRSDGFVTWAVSKTAGAKMPRLGSKELLGKEIPLPSVAEQNSVAQQFAKVDTLISLRKQQIAKLDELVKARFVEMFGDPVSNSKGFPSMTGESFFKLSNGKPVPEEKRFADGIPAYGGNGISWYTDAAMHTDDTLVVGRVGFQSGNVHLAKGPLWVTDNAMYMSAYRSDLYNLVFLCALMEHIDFTRYQDAGDLKKVTQKPFMQMNYIQPPLELQAQYTAFVAQTDQQKSTIQQSLTQLELLKKALMQKYFG